MIKLQQPYLIEGVELRQSKGVTTTFYYPPCFIKNISHLIYADFSSLENLYNHQRRFLISLKQKF